MLWIKHVIHYNFLKYGIDIMLLYVNFNIY